MYVSIETVGYEVPIVLWWQEKLWTLDLKLYRCCFRRGSRLLRTITMLSYLSQLLN